MTGIGAGAAAWTCVACVAKITTASAVNATSEMRTRGRLSGALHATQMRFTVNLSLLYSCSGAADADARVLAVCRANHGRLRIAWIVSPAPTMGESLAE